MENPVLSPNMNSHILLPSKSDVVVINMLSTSANALFALIKWSTSSAVNSNSISNCSGSSYHVALGKINGSANEYVKSKLESAIFI